MLSNDLLLTIAQIERYVILIRSSALDVRLQQSLSSADFRVLLKRYVKELDFLVEKLYEQFTFFYVENL